MEWYMSQRCQMPLLCQANTAVRPGRCHLLEADQYGPFNTAVSELYQCSVVLSN